jgi:hypothetical protein
MRDLHVHYNIERMGGAVLLLHMWLQWLPESLSI